MQDLTELLNSTLGQTTFGTHSGASMSPEHLRDVMERPGWHDEEIISARRAQPDIPDGLLSQLNNHLRTLLQEYIDPETDHIGHAFPIDSPRMYPIDSHHAERKEAFEPNGLWSFAGVSAVEDLSKGLIKGAVVIGADGESGSLRSLLRDVDGAGVAAGDEQKCDQRGGVLGVRAFS